MKKSVAKKSRERVAAEVEQKRAVEQLRYLRDHVAQYHRAWIEANDQGTLGTLLERLEAALEECACWDDALIAEHREEVGEELGHELDQWTVEDDETFDYRTADLEEYVGDVEGLIEAFGSEFIAAKLVKVTNRQITSAVKKLAA